MIVNNCLIGDNSFLGGIWDWVNTDPALYVLKGAVGGISDAWDISQRKDNIENLKRLRSSLDADLIRLRDELAAPKFS